MQREFYHEGHLMPPSAANTHSEGLRAARLLMVLSSVSPLFILWAIRGNSLIPGSWFAGFCALMGVVARTPSYGCGSGRP